MKVFEADRHFSFTRRRLLQQGLGGLALSAAAPGSALAQTMFENPNIREVDGILTGAHWGAFRAVVKDGKFVEAIPLISTPADDLIRATPEIVYSETRIKYPHVRRAFLEKGYKADPAGRGRDEWVRVPWDKALSLVAAEIKRVRSEAGGSSILGGLYGWKSAGLFHNSRHAVRRLMYLGGGCQGYFGDYSTGAAQIIMPHVVGTIEVYDPQTAWPMVVEHSQLVVLWGCDALLTLKNSWNIPDFGGYEGLRDLRDKGTRVIAIDPIRTGTAKALNAEWIPIRQRTDGAMLLGIMHTLQAEQLHDVEFLKSFTVGWPQVEDYLTGKKDSTPKSAEWASALCGVPAERIRQLARDMAKNRTMIMAGWVSSVSRMANKHTGWSQRWRRCSARSGSQAVASAPPTTTPRAARRRPRAAR
jgi:trimethylamine-N-oxide reductase (cytochrome c)